MGGTNKSVIGTFGNGVIITGTGPGGGGITIIPPGSLRKQSNFSLGLGSGQELRNRDSFLAANRIQD